MIKSNVTATTATITTGLNLNTPNYHSSMCIWNRRKNMAHTGLQATPPYGFCNVTMLHY